MHHYSAKRNRPPIKRSRQILLTDTEWETLRGMARLFGYLHNNQPSVAQFVRAIANHHLTVVIMEPGEAHISINTTNGVE